MRNPANKYRLLFLLFFLLPVYCFAQKTITGQVVDEKDEPLPSVVVKVFDATGSKLLAYGSTTQDGAYRVEVKLEPDKCLVRYSALGYRQVERQVTKTGEMGRTVLKEGDLELKEVTVRGTPVINRGDTIHYNVAQLKDKTDRKIEDVIKKLPGIEVEASGLIKYNGKPINKFYIEGADMLGGRYALASRNINADDIATVSVYQNHQPKRALEGIQFSDQAALNLKLKSERMLKPVGSVSVGGGGNVSASDNVDDSADRVLWNVDAYTLLVAPNKQFLVTAKGNDMAQFYDSEMTDQFGTYSSLMPLVQGRLRPVLSGSSNVPASRSRTNRSAATTYNSLHKVATDINLTINAGYHYDRIAGRQDKRTTYWSAGDTPIVVDENSMNRARKHQGWLTMQLESNHPTFYLNNQLDMQGQLADYRDEIRNERTTRQKVRSGEYLLNNSLQAIWRRGSRAFSLSSLTSFGSVPESQLTAATTTAIGDSMLVDQVLDGLRFHNLETTSLSWGIGRIVTLSVNASILADYDRMSSHFLLSNEEENSRYGGYQLLTSLYPKITIMGGKLRGSIELPVRLVNLHYRDLLESIRYDYDQPLVGVNASFYYDIFGLCKLQFGANHQRILGNMLNYVTQPIYTTYRTRSALGSGVLNSRDKTSGNLSLTYRNVITGVNASLSALYQFTHGNVISGSMVTTEHTVTAQQQLGNNADQWNISASLSRNIYDWHTILRLNANTSLNRMEMMRQGIVSRVTNNIYSVEASVTSTLLHQLLALNAGGSYTLDAQRVSGQQTYHNDFSVLASATVFPLPGWGWYLRANGSFVENPTIEAAASRYNTCIYIDAGTQYLLGKVELELSARNLTNRQQYRVRQFSGCDTFDYCYYLRPLEVAVAVRYTF